MQNQWTYTLALLALLAVRPATAQPSWKVQVDRPAAPISPTMWGIFFEDINFAADGGIYAELIKNRSFEFSNPLMGWKQQGADRFSLNPQSGDILIVNRAAENPSNQHFARVNVHSDKEFVVSNEGFRGVGFKKDNTYHFSIWARQQQGTGARVVVEATSAQGNVLGQATVTVSGGEWKPYTASFTTTATEPKGAVTVRFQGKGVVDVDMISLFPADTWKQRPNGFRADLIQWLADMKPGFIRFPGGCIVEGFHLDARYQWKKTVGPPEGRQLMKNRWNDEFKHRPAPDYFQSFGVGFYEYFLLAEDIGAAPLPIISCGMACQFNSAEVAPLEALDAYVQDALDLIEFANGTASSAWGKVRAQMGHPAPFNLKYIGVGNEQWGPAYIERYEVFAKAIKEKYPDIHIVSGTGPFPDGEMFDYAWKELRKLNADVVDEHYYRDPQWFFQNTARYDAYDRKGPKVFAGEYAAQSVATVSPENKNTWLCALSEAAFMTGLERNADVVVMASYAPLFAHVDGWQWTPDLIWFDNLRSYGTPNYYVQKLFATNRGTHILPLVAGAEAAASNVFASAVWDEAAKEVIIKVVNANAQPRPVDIQLEGSAKYQPAVRQTVLSHADPNSVNSLNDPAQIVPREGSVKLSGKNLRVSMAAQSLTVLRVKMK